jgi:hypothetical protein
VPRLTIRVSHAVPHVREALCRAAHDWKNGARPTDRDRAFERATGILVALRIMIVADDWDNVPGIANRASLPPGAVRAAASLARDDFREVLGLDDTDPLDEAEAAAE